MSVSPRVLSIQSHVVHGYVGNKSATFPLQLLGFEVDGINSVQLSNHTGYKVFTGQILKESDLGKSLNEGRIYLIIYQVSKYLEQLADGLSANKLDTSYTHLLTGYVKNASFLLCIEKLIFDLKEKNPNLVYVCDPVLGDNGKLYVPEDLVSIFRDSIISLADIITPNQFELEKLSGIKPNTIEKTLEAIDILHAKGCNIVVISSAEYSTTDKLTIIASHKNDGELKRSRIEIPKIKTTFTGTGDLFSALFLAWMSKTNDISKTLESTVSTVYAVISRTVKHHQACPGDNCERKGLELKLIQSKEDIENPKILFKSKEI